MSPWGLCVHTSGRGIVARASRRGEAPIDVALAWYRRKSGVHYVIGYDGAIYQMLDDDRRGAHVGISWLERRRYLSGSWKRHVPPRALREWQRRWPHEKSPQHLYPTKSPNGSYIGVEMIPLAHRRIASSFWFTDAQHASVALLYKDWAARHCWGEYHASSPRLLGHEDIDAFARWDKAGGWDPGAMRQLPRFGWHVVRDIIAE